MEETFCAAGLGVDALAADFTGTAIDDVAAVRGVQVMYDIRSQVTRVFAIRSQAFWQMSRRLANFRYSAGVRCLQNLLSGEDGSVDPMVMTPINCLHRSGCGVEL